MIIVNTSGNRAIVAVGNRYGLQGRPSKPWTAPNSNFNFGAQNFSPGTSTLRAAWQRSNFHAGQAQYGDVIDIAGFAFYQGTGTASDLIAAMDHSSPTYGSTRWFGGFLWNRAIRNTPAQVRIT